MKQWGRYEYKEARAAALEERTPEALEALANWLDRYDPAAWGGEYYDIDDGRALRPVYDGDGEIVGYELGYI